MTIKSCGRNDIGKEKKESFLELNPFITKDGNGRARSNNYGF